jgi:uncharacterized protein (TIGR02452 family)
MKRVAIAQETVKILETGHYFYEARPVEIARELSECLEGTKYYHPYFLAQIEREILARSPSFSQTLFELKNETTLMGAERLARSQNFEKIGILNFASARNPGGGFLNGAQAQEESLARSSGLYKSLLKAQDYYDFHRSYRSLLYSNRMVYSPGCPVFRKDDGTLLAQPYRVDFITSPAPNAGAIARQQPEAVAQIIPVLRDRASKVLSLAAYHHCDALVLGAWGCGVFRNDPAIVAQIFADFLLSSTRFWGRFKTVLFSVLDSSKNRKIYREFEKAFSKNLQ